MKSIICAECNKPINRKEEFVVSGKLLQPYHAECLDKPNSHLGKLHKFTGKFPMGIWFWILIICGNIVIWEILRRDPDFISALIIFGVILNIVFIGARVGIYYRYEPYLE
jgi:hypothetical protein